MRKYLFTLGLLVSLSVMAQQTIDRMLFNYDLLKTEYEKGSESHTAFKRTFLDSSNLVAPFEFSFKKGVETQFYITPVMDFSFGVQQEDEQERDGLLGFGVGADVRFVHKKWNAGFVALGNAQQYMNYQDRFIVRNKVVPGMSIAKEESFIKSNYFSGFVNFEPNEYFNFEAGYGRNFIGDGYRSLLLSDAANASPYLKIQTNFWKFQYTNLFTSHRNIYDIEDDKNLYQKKYTATHYLDWKATKWLTIGLFETIIWGAKEGNYTRGFDPNYANPFIFYRPVEFSVGSSDNALVGANVKFTLGKNHVLYSQALFDEFLLDELQADITQLRNPNDSIRSGWWANKYGLQIGWTAFDLFKVKGLQTRVEFNAVRPYTYAHSSPTQAYSNDNISLAHPLGANFYEFIAHVNYEVKRWNLGVKYHQSKQGVSSSFDNYGDNLQLSNATRIQEYENRFAQGSEQIVKYAEASASFLLNKNANAIISLSYLQREITYSNSVSSNNLIMLRLHSNLFSKYFDY